MARVVVVSNNHQGATWETRIEKEGRKEETSGPLVSSTRTHRRQKTYDSDITRILVLETSIKLRFSHIYPAIWIIGTRKSRLSRKTNLEGCGKVLVL